MKAKFVIENEIDLNGVNVKILITITGDEKQAEEKIKRAFEKTLDDLDIPNF